MKKFIQSIRYGNNIRNINTTLAQHYSIDFIEYIVQNEPLQQPEHFHWDQYPCLDIEKGNFMCKIQVLIH